MRRLPEFRLGTLVRVAEFTVLVIMAIVLSVGVNTIGNQSRTIAGLVADKELADCRADARSRIDVLFFEGLRASAGRDATTLERTLTDSVDAVAAYRACG